MEYLESRMLNRFVNHGVHTIRCAVSPHKFHRGLLLGDLCAEGHHLMWAIKVWKLTLNEIPSIDANKLNRAVELIIQESKLLRAWKKASKILQHVNRAPDGV